jgi:uncharacterized SAM-binding protein YcdF (DUF218 family)
MTSFTVSKILSLLVYPLSLSLLLCLFSLLFSRLRWERTGFWCLFLGIAWLYLCSTAVVADLLTDRLERDYVPRAMSVVPEADAIVLLGGATRGDTHMGTLADLNRHADRLVHTVALYKAGKAPVVLVTGGTPSGGGRPEAKQIKDLLVVMGIPTRRILLENVSRNTSENASFSAQILQSRDMREILLVTSAYHMRRAQALFEAQDLAVIPAPTDYQQVVTGQVLPGWLPSVDALHQSTDALHEMVGFWVYRFRGWL